MSARHQTTSHVHLRPYEFFFVLVASRAPCDLDRLSLGECNPARSCDVRRAVARAIVEKPGTRLSFFGITNSDWFATRIRYAAALRLLPLLFVPLAVISRQVSGQSLIPYRDASAPIDLRVRDLLGRMTLDEKFWQLFMIPGDLDDPAHDYSQRRRSACRSRPRRTTRQPLAARRTPSASTPSSGTSSSRRGSAFRSFRSRKRCTASVRDGATMFPAGDRARGDVGHGARWHASPRAIARETRSRGIRQVLSPVINIANDVRWGRVEETYGEDPFLSSQMGVAFVARVRARGRRRDAEALHRQRRRGWARQLSDRLRATRLLEEMYFPPFEAAIDRGARALGDERLQLRGRIAGDAESRAAQRTCCKRDWGFTGFVISDAAATGGATVLHTPKRARRRRRSTRSTRASTSSSSRRGRSIGRISTRFGAG